MSLTYADCLDLKNAGFPQKGNGGLIFKGESTPNIGGSFDLENSVYEPTLSELIRECGDCNLILAQSNGGWNASGGKGHSYSILKAETPEKAVKSLYCALQGK